MRRINSREEKTKIDSEKLTITQPRRLPRSSPAMTREKEETEDFLRDSHPSDLIVEPNAKSKFHLKLWIIISNIALKI